MGMGYMWWWKQVRFDSTSQLEDCLCPVEPGDGGFGGKGTGGQPEVTVPGCWGIHAIPPGPTITVVDTPSIVVVSEEVPVNVVNGASVEAVNVTSVVLEPSMAVIVITVLVGT
jgi:hypothetical protein